MAGFGVVCLVQEVRCFPGVLPMGSVGFWDVVLLFG